MKLSTFVVVLARACPSFPISSRSRRSFYRIALLISTFFSSAQAEQPHNELSPLINQINQYAKSLDSLELKQSEVHTLVLDRVLSILAPPSFEYEYWREAAVSTNVMAMSNRLDQAQRAREILIAVYGSKAIQSRAFEQLFFPINEEAEFLSSDEQIALTEYRQQQFIELNKRPSGTFDGRLEKGVSPQAIQERPKPMDMLNAESAFEYQIRYSKIADAIRNSGVIFSENLFRQVFAILYDAEKARGQVIFSTSDFHESKEKLVDLLGFQKTLRVQSQFDPMFTPIKMTAEQLKINDVELFEAYEVLSNNTQASKKVLSQNRDNPSALKQLSTQVRKRNRAQLAKLLGQTRADRFITSFQENQRRVMLQLTNDPNLALRPNAY